MPTEAEHGQAFGSMTNKAVLNLPGNRGCWLVQTEANSAAPLTSSRE